MAPTERATAAKRLLAERSRELAQRAKRRVETGQVRVIHFTLGPQWANRFFWNSPTTKPTWFDAQRRLEWLADVAPADVEDFVIRSLTDSADPTTIIGLARHPFSTTIAREWLDEARRTRPPALADRLVSSRLTGGAVAGAARLLLDPCDADSIFEWVNGLYQLPDSSTFEILDSVSYFPTPNPRGHRLGDGAVQHRLIIAEHFSDLDSLALLLPGAAKITLMATSDTFGHADFVPYQEWPGVGDITIEHVRSRATRFSSVYIELHEAVRRLACELTDRIGDLDGMIDEAERAFLEVEIADFIFFQALKIRAVDLLVEENGFDEVIFAVDRMSERPEFLDLMTQTSLMSDPRLRIVSVSRSVAARASFWSILDRVLSPVAHDRPTAVASLPEDLVLTKFDEDAARQAALIELDFDPHTPSVLIVTASNAAYVEATVGYAAEVQPRFAVKVLHIGRNATELAGLLDAASLATSVPIGFIAPGSGRLAAFAELIDARVGTIASDDVDPGPDTIALGAFLAARHRLMHTVVAPACARLRIMRHWLSTAVEAGSAPSVIIATPNRNVGVSGITASARRFGVPTVVLEPHVHDANYCRYLKVASDYYGIMSEHFRSNALTQFGMTHDRVFAIGSPRQVAPTGFDPDEARRQARLEFEAQTGYRFRSDTTYVVYFCQPSDWTHVAKVWRNILEATRRRSSVVLLKTHPEESVSRTSQYLALAASMEMSDRVVLLETDAPTAISLADAALTAYSTAGIDAAVRRTPVICVTDGDLPYPIDLPAIIGAHRAGSADELTALLESFQTSPESLLAQGDMLMESEPQLFEGPGRRLRDLLDLAIARGERGIRPKTEVPSTLFLDGPHPLFPV